MKTHREIYGAYSSALADFELQKSDLETVDSQIQDLNANFVSRIALAQTDEEKRNLRDDFREDLINLNKRRAEITTKKYQASREYNERLKAWAPFKDELDWLQNVETNLQSSFDKMQILADQSLERSERLVKVLEEKIVGVASTGYSLSLETLKDLGLDLTTVGIIDLTQSDMQRILAEGATELANELGLIKGLVA